MSIEQIEAELVGWLKTNMTVVLPIRGTILQTFTGTLALEGDIISEDLFSVFRLESIDVKVPYTLIAFRAHDVKELRKKKPEDGGTENIILLKTDFETEDYFENLVKDN